MKLLLAFILVLLPFAVAVNTVADGQAKFLELGNSKFAEATFQIPRSQKDERCLTEAIYYEAGNQSEIGKEVVALVIMNRVMSPRHPKTICGVVTQAHVVEIQAEDGPLKKLICQFSFHCEPKYKPNRQGWAESEKVAHRVLTSLWHREVLDQFRNAVYFHADYVNPKWRKTKVFLGKIDRHLFYGEKQTCESTIPS